MWNKKIAVSFFSLFLTLTSLSQERVAKRPNIVFILADDLGYGDIGVYGQSKIKTPNIDRLAKEGMLFRNFYAGTSVCAPSRSSLLTGQHTGHTFIRGNKEVEPEGQFPLADTVQTMAMLLKRAGYVTGAFGKWGLGMVGTTGDPNKKGFDEFFGYNCQRQSHRYYPTHLWHNDKKIILTGNDLSKKEHYAPELIQQKALEFIEKNQKQQFFLYIPYVLPHAELAGPEDEHYLRYKDAFEEKRHTGNDYGPGATVPGYASVEKPRATFAAMVSRLDAYVGEVLKKLDQLGLKENTIVVFTSDNGAHREGGADPDFFKSSGDLRGYKRDLYEGGIRVPFIVSWPGKVKQNTTNMQVGTFWDVLPTFREITKASKPGYTDGISLLKQFYDANYQPKKRVLYWEFHEDGGKQAVRWGDWKLIRFQVRNRDKSYYELYNLKDDPSEKKNVADQYPSLLQELKSKMDREHVESKDYPLSG